MRNSGQIAVPFLISFSVMYPVDKSFALANKQFLNFLKIIKVNTIGNVDLVYILRRIISKNVMRGFLRIFFSENIFRFNLGNTRMIL